MDIYNPKSYVVYHIIYSGDKLPPNYIGSTSIKRIESGYMGSVRSKNYKNIWKQELKEHPELFHLEIISYHDTRPEATYKELQIQKLFNVVKNPLFVNMSYAQPNGFFGMDTSTHMLGNKNALGCKHSDDLKKLWSELAKKKFDTIRQKCGKIEPTYIRTDDHKKAISLRNIGNTYGKGKRSQSFIDNLSKSYQVISPTNEVMVITNLTSFCKLHNLNPCNMYNVASGGQSNHKGWKCARL